MSAGSASVYDQIANLLSNQLRRTERKMCVAELRVVAAETKEPIKKRLFLEAAELLERGGVACELPRPPKKKKGNTRT